MKKLALTFILGATILSADFINTTNTVKDVSNKLEWQNSYPEGTIKRADWQGAIEYCENLVLDGKDDWRLPHIKELLSITDYTKRYGSEYIIDDAFDISIVDLHTYDLSRTGDYCSSTTVLSNPTQAYVVRFETTVVKQKDKVVADEKSKYAVRCIRQN